MLIKALTRLLPILSQHGRVPTTNYSKQIEEEVSHALKMGSSLPSLAHLLRISGSSYVTTYSYLHKDTHTVMQTMYTLPHLLYSYTSALRYHVKDAGRY